MSHVSSYPCIKLPVAELTAVSHEHSVPMIVDGAHALGNIPIDIGAMSDVDFWCGPGLCFFYERNSQRRRLTG